MMYRALLPFCIILFSIFCLSISIVALHHHISNDSKSEPRFLQKKKSSTPNYPTHNFFKKIALQLRGGFNGARCNDDSLGPPTQSPEEAIESIAEVVAECDEIPNTYSWTQIGNDIDGNFENANTGSSISLNGAGTRVAIGGKGSLKIFDWYRLLDTGENGWNFAGNLGPYFDELVVSVSLSINGNYLVAGEQSAIKKKSKQDVNVGTVSIFQKNADHSWTQVGNTLTGVANDGFGRSVDISDDGTNVAIGAPFGQYVRIYNLEGLTWSLRFSQTSDNFGWSISLTPDGEIVAIGAPNQLDASIGAAYVYNVTNMSLIQKIEGDIADDKFGESISLSNNGMRLAVGAPGANYVKVLDYDVSKSNYMEAFVIENDLSSASKFGNSIALNGDGSLIVVGSPDFDSNLGEKAGKVCVYYLSDCRFKEIGTFFGEAETDNAGSSVAISNDGKQLAFGAIKNEGIFEGSNATFDAGQVRIFQINV